MTLLDASGHGVADGGGAVGSKRHSLRVLRKVWISSLSRPSEYCPSIIVGEKLKYQTPLLWNPVAEFFKFK